MFRPTAALLITLLAVTLSFGKDKNKDKKDKSHPQLSEFVLRAQTAYVVIDPDAGEPVTDPMANARARDDVERALMKWRRFRLVPDPSLADLVISVRRGSGSSVSPTIRGGPIDQRPVIFQPNDGDVRMGGQRGQPPGTDPRDPLGRQPHIGTEVGEADDTMEVFLGTHDEDNALTGSPVWRYIAKDALRGPNVPAVDQFRKAIDDSEKAAAKKAQHP